MENQTRYDLNAAMESWRQELAAQPNLASDVRREVETHLRDTVAELQRRGLNDEESFWLACRRVGRPQQLGEEFEKADPAKAWRERAFWIVLMLALIEFWFAIFDYLSRQINSAIWYHPKPSWFHWLFDYCPPLFYFYLELLKYVPILCLVFLLARGRMNWVGRAFQFVFRSRWQFVLTALALVLIFHNYNYDNSAGNMMTWPDEYWFIQYCSGLLSTKICPLSLITLIAWLMPAQTRRAPKLA